MLLERFPSDREVRRWHPSRHQDFGDPLRRLERHRVAEFESPLALPPRGQARRPQGGLGRFDVASLYFEAKVAPPL